MKNLGKLSKVDLRDYWNSESEDFTPWLAEPENLNLLGEAIKMELEPEGIEQSVGDSDFRVDILAKEVDSDEDNYVVIENQLEKTNHDHLGKLLTYASGHSAKTVIWIAEKIREEHRRALDWLNENSSDKVAFFGLEIKLFQIGDSPPAPKFNLISQPNGWFKNMQAKNTKTELTKTKSLQGEFWTKFVEYMENEKSILNLTKPRPQHWYILSVGSASFYISLNINSSKKQIACKLTIRNTARGYKQLERHKEVIEHELGANLIWRKMPDKKSSEIRQNHNGDFTNKLEWPQLFKWFKERTEAFHKTFSKRIKELDLDEDLDSESAA